MDVDGRVADALAQACNTVALTQEQLAAAAGVDQTTISKWTRGQTRVPLRVLPLIERAGGLPLGYILRNAGLVEPDRSWPVRHLLASDPDIEPGRRDQLVALYDIFRRDSALDVEGGRSSTGRAAQLDSGGYAAEQPAGQSVNSLDEQAG